MAGNLLEKFTEAEKLEKCGQNKAAADKYTEYIVSYTKIQESGERELTENERKHLALAYNNRGYVRYLMVDFNEAIEDYTEGVKLDPRMHFSFYNRGLIHYRLGRFREAITDMERCLAIESDFEPAQQCLNQSVKDLNNKKNTSDS